MHYRITDEELARHALEFMSDIEIGLILLEEFGERSHAIKHILEGNGTVVERLARQERDYLAIVEEDRQCVANWRLAHT